jgi:hypothetical protein
MKNIFVRIQVLLCLVALVSACKTSSKLDAKDQLTVSAWELNTLDGKAVDAKQFMTGLPYLAFDIPDQQDATAFQVGTNQKITTSA